MAVPVISNLPPAPSRSDGSADFTPKADAMIGALQPMVVQVNIATQWMAGQLTEAQAQAAAAAASALAAANSATAANASKNAAAQSAIDATNNGAAQVALAAAQVELAENAKDSAEAAAAAVGAAAGLPPDRLPYSVLQINAAGNVSWGDGLIDKTPAVPGQALMLDTGKTPHWAFPGQQIGDVLISARNPGALYLPANGTIRSQSTYADLFSKVGLIGGDVGVSWAELDPSLGGTNTGPVGASLAGTIIVVISGSIRRSTDRGNTWATISLPLTGIYSNIDTDQSGTWVIAGSLTQLLRSTDDGLTWQIITVPAATSPGGYSWGFIKYCGGNTWIGAQNGTNGQLLRSTNNGLSFAAVASGGLTSGATAIGSNGKGTILVSGNTVRKSTDFGATWGSGPITTDPVSSMDTDENGLWVMVTSATNSQNGIYRSLDDALTFSLFPIPGYTSGLYWVSIAYGLIFFRIASSAAVPKLYVYLGNGVFKLYSDTVNVGGTNGGYRGAVVDAGNGVLVGLSGTTVGRIVRSTPQFPYDTATQFALPTVSAPPGTAAYIKAKELA
jgi:hypothetical protein